MSQQDTGHDQVLEQEVVICAHCKNKARKDMDGNDLPADERSALWLFAILTPAEAAESRYFEEKKRHDGTPYSQFRHWKWRGNANPIHDGCRAELEAKVQASGMTVVFWPSEELRAIWREQRKVREAQEKARDAQQKEQAERDSLLASLLSGASSTTESPVVGPSVAETVGSGAAAKVELASETKPNIPPETPPTEQQVKSSPFGALAGLFNK
ncbi:hypothetical protein FJY93_04450 [Candidatus Kaiserbacteria bacterium]|nr:hypothetical protein [Candidatus Kaiserbacteria bacterium]